MAKEKKTLAVKFGSVNFGKESARIGVHVSRDRLDLEGADRLLTGAQLDVKMTLCSDLNNPTLPMNTDLPELSTSATCKSIGVKADAIGFGLTMQIVGLDTQKLIDFRNRDGKLVLTRTGDAVDLPSDTEGEPEGEE